jgi:4,5:9,10-diseco-3-hydroxy-5,9,17-trioxoandrosta-1(10),2-diene-4-oate hydrolase
MGEAKRMGSAKRTELGAERPGEGAGREVVVDGVRIAYDDEGAGSVLVCLHAIGHGARDFRRLRARLSSRYRVIALDWPGQGRSGDDRLPASAARYAELLAGFVDALRLGELVVLGNSIGGAAAIRFAAKHVRERGRARRSGRARRAGAWSASSRRMAAFFMQACGARAGSSGRSLLLRMGAWTRLAQQDIIEAALEAARPSSSAWRSGEPGRPRPGGESPVGFCGEADWSSARAQCPASGIPTRARPFPAALAVPRVSDEFEAALASGGGVEPEIAPVGRMTTWARRRAADRLERFRAGGRTRVRARHAPGSGGRRRDDSRAAV